MAAAAPASSRKRASEHSNAKKRVAKRAEARLHAMAVFQDALATMSLEQIQLVTRRLHKPPVLLVRLGEAGGEHYLHALELTELPAGVLEWALSHAKADPDETLFWPMFEGEPMADVVRKLVEDPDTRMDDDELINELNVFAQLDICETEDP